jgi:hypothetical protein
MIVEMLLIGGAIGLFTKRNRDRKDTFDNYNTNYSHSYSNSYTSSYSSGYDCFDEEQDEEEEDNKPQDYSYTDFENALCDYIIQNYSYCYYRKKIEIKHKLNDVYRHIYRKTQKIPSFAEVLAEYHRRTSIALNVKIIDEFLLENAQVIFLDKIKSEVRGKRISTINDVYSLGCEDTAIKYSYLKGVAITVNPRMVYLLEDDEIQSLLDNSMEAVINEFSNNNYYSREISSISNEGVCKRIVKRSLAKSLKNFNIQSQVDAAKNIILAEISLLTKKENNGEKSYQD